MPLTISPDDPRLTWQGVVSLERGDGWVMPWRIPHEHRSLFAEGLRLRASHPAGARLSFGTNSRSVAGRVEPTEDMLGLDLCCDGEVVGSTPMAGRDGFAFDGLPPSEKRVELWLPLGGMFRLRSLTLDDGASLRPFRDRRPRWVTYGSSITQCRSAQSPTESWPAIVARAMDLNLTCLGYGGNCNLEVSVARVMRDLPARFLSMCVGINVYGCAGLSLRTFRPAVIGFVQVVREKHPREPFVVMSPIYSPPRETAPNAVNLTMQIMRDEVAAAVQALRDLGDENLHYVSGLDVFGPEHTQRLPDQLHPDAEGYRILGRGFLEKAAQPYFRTSLTSSA